ncbi:MAG: tandem-95 repeat protein [Rhodanobacteraceae bacterium]|nr:tandem-95 repeat protein [Rhodanobacteraceae bacterium]
MHRRLVWMLAACGITLASAQYPPQNPDRIPSVTDPSIPLSYVGNDGSISLGVNAEGETEGQLMGVFARNDARAVVGQLWWDRAGAGGAQFDFNWLWGGDPIAAREHPDKATVSRLSFALDQSAQHARKATLGFGIERRDFSVEGWLAHGVGGARDAGRTLQDEVVRSSGRDELGDYTVLETTTIDTLFESKPFGTEVGLQFSHVFEPWATRVYGAGSTQDGDGARATTLSLGVDTPLGRNGWGLAARADHVQRSGLAGGDDNRLAVFLRYEFGRHGSFVPTAQLDSPAWIARSLARPSSAHPRTVETYRRVRSRNVTVTRGPRQYSNLFPLAQADSAGAVAGVPLTIDVLANDSDPDGDSLTVVAVGTPGHGSALIVGNAVVYTPDPGYSGAESFTYTISDGRGGSASASVGVNVSAQANRAPIARNDNAATQVAQPVTIAVLANDTDPDGDDLAVVAVGTPANGSTAISGGSVVYTPAAGYIGSDSFSYMVSDGHGGDASATVTIQVQPSANTPPVAAADSMAIAPGATVTINALVNDYDADGDPLTITWLGIPSRGVASIAGNSIVYTAATTALGTDTFSYRISDGRGGSASARITINIATMANQAPVAIDDTATTPAGTTVTVAVLNNDSDPDGDPLTITAVGTPIAGTAAIVGNTIVYTPTNPTFVGIDRFSYTISDGRGGTATAFVTITVTTLVNNPPVAVDDLATAPVGTPSLTINVLANDSDPDGDPLTISAIGVPSAGTAVISGNQVIYTPAVVTGTTIDRFAYQISDGRGGTATALVTINITLPFNQPPVAVDDPVNVQTGNSVTVYALGNDFDPDGDPLTITAVGTPSAGAATIVGHTIGYPAFATGIGADSFTYTISDGRGGTATAVVQVTITPTTNTPPIAVDDSTSVQRGATVTIAVLGNDSDADGDPLTIVSVTTPLAGAVTISGNAIVYTSLDPTFTGTDQFSYTISDGRGGTATANVAVLVIP